MPLLSDQYKIWMVQQKILLFNYLFPNDKDMFSTNLFIFIYTASHLLVQTRTTFSFIRKHKLLVTGIYQIPELHKFIIHD